MGLTHTRNGLNAWGMRLQAYLTLKKLTHLEFGKLIGASEHGVRKWARGERVPRPDAVRKIQDVTEGAVSPADFFDVTESGNQEAATPQARVG